jgi:hypothetical protein
VSGSGGGNHVHGAYYFSVYIFLCLGAHASELLPIGALLPSLVGGVFYSTLFLKIIF